MIQKFLHRTNFLYKINLKKYKIIQNYLFEGLSNKAFHTNLYFCHGGVLMNMGETERKEVIEWIYP